MSKIPLKRAVSYILLSTLLISGSAAFSFFYYLHYIEQRKQDPKFVVNAVVQSRLGGPALENGYLIELLGLSADRPVNLYRLSADEATARLEASPLIKEARVKKIRPGTLFIEYAAREPVALLGEWSNTYIDEEGFFCPCRPFVEPATLPVVYLVADSPCLWGERCSDAKMELALQIINDLKGQPVSLIDVSNAYAPSSGKRQVVIRYDDDLLRLKTEEYLTQIRHYLMLKQRITGSKVVDLRISQLAYIYDKEPLS